jgi:hypothetical protein
MIEELLKLITPLQVVVGIILLLLLRLFVNQIVEDRRIRQLGERAPSRQSWLPFGIQIAYEGVMSVKNYQTLEYFQEGTFAHLTKNDDEAHFYRYEALCKPQSTIYSRIKDRYVAEKVFNVYQTDRASQARNASS